MLCQSVKLVMKTMDSIRVPQLVAAQTNLLCLYLATSALLNSTRGRKSRAARRIRGLQSQCSALLLSFAADHRAKQVLMHNDLPNSLQRQMAHLVGAVPLCDEGQDSSSVLATQTPAHRLHVPA
jgi:hypothetical protein